MKLKVKYLKYIFHPYKIFNILFQLKYEIAFKKWLLNIFFQRILRINSEVDFQVNFTSIIVASDKITIGNNVWKSFALSGNCYIQGGNGIYIGDDTIFAPGVKIISADHDPTNAMAWKEVLPIRIGKRCWLGVNAVILPGVEIGDDCVVGAGAVVNSSFPSGSIIVGVPAYLKKINYSDKTNRKQEINI